MRRGFTLLEAMVAVSILAIAVGAPLYGASRALVAARIAQDKLTASYLAQEGVEYTRRYRDDQFLAAYPDTDGAWGVFDTNVNGACGDEKTCSLDLFQSFAPFKTCPSQACPTLHLDPSTKVYSYRTDGNTNFTRTLHYEKLSDDESRIISTVEWDYRGTIYSVTVAGHLTSWQ